MTGKELRAFANQLSDDCLVEVEKENWNEKWVPLDPRKLSAVMKPNVDTNVLMEE